MQIAIIQNGQITQIGDYRYLFPETSFTPNGPDDAWLAENNAKRVNLYKDHDPKTQKLVQSDPYVDGDFVSLVTVAPLTTEELAALTETAKTVARNQRNMLLSQTDWTQLVDSPEANKAAWATYRQALRDLPSQSGFPDNIVWPVQPTETK